MVSGYYPQFLVVFHKLPRLKVLGDLRAITENLMRFCAVG